MTRESCRRCAYGRNVEAVCPAYCGVGPFAALVRIWIAENVRDGRPKRGADGCPGFAPRARPMPVALGRSIYPLHALPGVHVILYTGEDGIRVVAWAGVSYHKAAAAWARTVGEHGHAEAEVWHGDALTHTAAIGYLDSAATVWEVTP